MLISLLPPHLARAERRPEGKIAGRARSSIRPATQGESSAARARAAVWCVRGCCWCGADVLLRSLSLSAYWCARRAGVLGAMLRRIGSWVAQLFASNQQPTPWLPLPRRTRRRRTPPRTPRRRPPRRSKLASRASSAGHRAWCPTLARPSPLLIARATARP